MKREVKLVEVSPALGCREAGGDWKPLQELYDDGWEAKLLTPTVYGTQDRHQQGWMLLERTVVNAIDELLTLMQHGIPINGSQVASAIGIDWPPRDQVSDEQAYEQEAATFMQEMEALSEPDPEPGPRRMCENCNLFEHDCRCVEPSFYWPILTDPDPPAFQEPDEDGERAVNIEAGTYKEYEFFTCPYCNLGWSTRTTTGHMNRGDGSTYCPTLEGLHDVNGGRCDRCYIIFREAGIQGHRVSFGKIVCPNFNPEEVP
jgi:hypothetical protein